MDKNIVAFLREDVRTVNVKFFPDVKNSDNWEEYDRYARQTSGKEYKYICTFPDVKPGDLCMVFVGQRPAIVEVQSVDAVLGIEPNESKEYKYIAALISTAAYDELMAKNAELKQMLAESYRKITQNNFRAMFLSGMDEEARTRLLGVLK